MNLRETLDEADWELLKPHAERGVLILVSNELDLLTVGETIARDHKDTVSEWLKKGLLFKPNEEKLEALNQTPTKLFLCIVVQPFVLAQEILMN